MRLPAFLAAVVSRTLLVLFGFMVAFVFLELLLHGVALGVRLKAEYFQNTFVADRSERRILCIGESTTFGTGGEPWPSKLERLLNKRSKAYSYKVINRGVPGISSEEIVEKLPRWLDSFKPAIAVSMVGINDRGNRFFKAVE